MCEDVIGKGRWGNGNIELKLTKMEDIPYITGLVRQALEKQLGEESKE